MSADNKPKLYIFVHSHFCEKGRWTLSHHGIDFEPAYLAPGMHMAFAKKHKLPSTSLPILRVNGEMIQGSSSIIDWAEAKCAEPERSLAPTADADKCLELEKRLDDVLGVHVRRFYYSEALIEYPGRVRQVFSKDLSFFPKILLRGMWPMVRKRMIEMMDLGTEQREDSKRVIEEELDWLDETLSDGRGYLLGDKFSRADLTAASLLAPIVRPKEHPVYNKVSMPPKMTTDMEKWSDRQSIKWVRDIYKKHR
jgi:glutathione S-transferase